METLATGINKPRLIVGIEKKLFVVCLLGAFGVMWVCQSLIGIDTLFSLLISSVAFFLVASAAWKLTDIDKEALSLAPSVLKQKNIYDPGRRDNSRVVIEER